MGVVGTNPHINTSNVYWSQNLKNTFDDSDNNKKKPLIFQHRKIRCFLFTFSIGFAIHCQKKWKTHFSLFFSIFLYLSLSLFVSSYTFWKMRFRQVTKVIFVVALTIEHPGHSFAFKIYFSFSTVRNNFFLFSYEDSFDQVLLDTLWKYLVMRFCSTEQ